MGSDMPDSSPPNSAPPEVIERLDCDSAKAFLGALNPQDALWGPDIRQWVFRGQSGEWPLLPKSYRKGEWFEQLGLPAAMPDPSDQLWPLHAARVKQLLREFSAELDLAGLPVPAPAPAIEGTTNRRQLSSDPEPEALPTLALAQHYGLPTPWLDWSVQPRSAAYFACSDLVWKPKEAGRMVVWALRRDFVTLALGRHGHYALDGRGLYMTLESAPRAGNLRLHAQGGLFSWLHGELAHERTVDEHVAILAASLATATTPNVERRKLWDSLRGPYMRCFSLDRSHAPALLKMLANEGITAATTFPDYAGVAQTMRERAWCNYHYVL
jgi:hypothetical protein